MGRKCKAFYLFLSGKHAKQWALQVQITGPCQNDGENKQDTEQAEKKAFHIPSPLYRIT